ncbi:MAG: ABC transporter substrate-binding protein [Candidatus Lustribacter sp.]|jgi:NitT/TauT family transport system substrate-binding protein
MQRKTFVLGLAALGLLDPGAIRAAVADAAVIHAASSIDDDATPFIWAIQSGLFAKNGIDADLQRATSGAASVAGVIGGSFQIAKSSVTSLCTAHARGLPLVWIAPGGEYDSSLPPVIGLIVRADGPVKTGSDLNGKTVGVSALNDFFSLAARAWTDAHGGDSSTLKLTEIPMSQSSAAVASGRIDAAIVVQPFFEEAKADPKIRIIGDPSSALGAHFMQSTWFASTDFAAKNGPVVERFIRVMREASAYVNGHHAETADLVGKFMKVDVEPLKVRIPQGVRFNPAQMQALVDVQARYKMIPASFDVHDVIYPAALRA